MDPVPVLLMIDRRIDDRLTQSTYFILHQNSGSAQFYKDAWVGSTPNLPVCDDSGNPDGTDYSGCYSGWFTDACQMGYDYTSIMHYGLTS